MIVARFNQPSGDIELRKVAAERREVLRRSAVEKARRDEAIWRMHGEGRSHAAIARDFGVKTRTVYAIVVRGRKAGKVVEPDAKRKIRRSAKRRGPFTRWEEARIQELFRKWEWIE